MPGLSCSYGDVTRIDLPMPFFLLDDPFINFKNLNYNWNPKKNVTVLVKSLERPTTKSVTNEDGENMDQESIGGCPLECPFDPNENFEEAIRPNLPEATFPGLDFSLNQYSSMELQTCRSLVKKIYDRDEETLQNLRLDRVAGKYTFSNPIYVACDGSPSAKDLVMIGFDEEKFLELRMMGPYKRQSTQLNLDLFSAYHQHLPNVVPSSVHKQVHAIYEKPHGQHSAAGQLFIEFLWSDPKTLFEAPPPLTSFVKLTIKPKPGDANPYLVELWKEIEYLENFIAMMDSGEYDSEQSILASSTIEAATSNSSIFEKIQALLNEPSVPNWKKGLGADKNFFQNSDSIENMLRRVTDLDRSNVDFTDKLWSILKTASSPSELRECLYYVFSKVEAKLYRPYLFPSNETMISSIVKKIGNQNENFRAKMSSLQYILAIVVDCGIHKLYKDYCFVLGMCKLADQNEFNIFAPKARMVKESLMDVKKFHCMLEILCLCRDRLALNLVDQESHFRTLVNHFSTNKVDWDHTFHFDVPFNAVSNFIVGSHPIYWNLKLESSNCLRIARTNAILSRDFFIGHARKFYVGENGEIPRGFYLYVHRIAERRRVSQF